MANETNRFEELANDMLQMAREVDWASCTIELRRHYMKEEGLPIDNYSLREFLELIQLMKDVKDQYNEMSHRLEEMIDEILDIC